MDLRDSGRASLRASRVLMAARTEPRSPKYTFPDSQDHARSFRRSKARCRHSALFAAAPICGRSIHRASARARSKRDGLRQTIRPSRPIRKDVGTPEIAKLPYADPAFSASLSGLQS